MRQSKFLALLLSVLLLVGLLPAAAFAAEDGTYVLMNIPYAEFYAAELGADADVDAISAATAKKRSNGGLAGGTYHVGAEGAGIDGVIYPVLVSDVSVLDSAKQLTDEASIEVSTTARGQTTTTTYEGRDALFEAEDYSWYLLDETPSHYKALTVGADGSFSFGAVTGETATVDGVTGAVTYNARHADIEIKLSGTEGIAQGDAVSAVIVTTADGAKYGLGHVNNIWRATEIGWDGDELMKAGKGAVSITNIRYITRDAVIDYPVTLNIAARGVAGFTDIDADAWYADAAAWCVAQGYLSNRGDGHFAAGDPLTRAEIVSYLWTAAGSPAPETAENPFTDIAEDASYYKAVLWAYENGYTDGEGDGRFAPDNTLDRSVIVTFLWKQAGKPAPKTETSPFTDVAEDDWFRDPVLWAVENGVTDGTDAEMKLFSPAAKVTLGQVVTFLYKYGMGAAAFEQLTGSYVELFPEMSLEKYRSVWDEVLAPYAADDEAKETLYQAFTVGFMGEVYGQEAVSAYAGDPEEAVFNCFFLHGVETLNIDGNTISGTDPEGKELFRHSYHYVGDQAISYLGEETPAAMHVYESDDPDSGDFRYFAFSDDTPGETYHLEFRYGASPEGIGEFTDGDYAYWLAAAIPADYDDQLMTDCITLFVTENLGEAE